MDRPLLVTADPVAVEDLLRLAATAGADLEVVAEPWQARRAWSAAPLVLVGADLLEACAAARLPRRPGVVALGGSLDDASVWRRAVDVGAERVVFLPDAEPWLVQALADAGSDGAGRSALVAVLGGRGGAGATTLAVALGVAGARRGLTTLLVDGDRFGGGLDLVLGAEGAPGLRWPDLAQTRGRLPGAVVSEGLPRAEGLALLTWDRARSGEVPVDVVEAVLDAARRTCDLVVVDLPRVPDELGREVLAAASCGLLVVPAEVRAAAAAGAVAAHAGLLCRDLRLVVRGPSPGGLTAEEVQSALGLPLAGWLRAEPHLDAHLEQGRLPGRRTRSPLRVLCEGLLDELVGADRRWAA